MEMNQCGMVVKYHLMHLQVIYMSSGSHFLWGNESVHAPESHFPAENEIQEMKMIHFGMKMK